MIRKQHGMLGYCVQHRPVSTGNRGSSTQQLCCGAKHSRYLHAHRKVQQVNEKQRIKNTHLMLCPLDGLQVDALLHQLPQRAHLPQLVYVGHLGYVMYSMLGPPVYTYVTPSHQYTTHREVNRTIYFLCCCKAPNTISDACVCHFLIHTQCTQHV